MAQPRHRLLRHFGRGHTAEYRGSTTPLECQQCVLSAPLPALEDAGSSSFRAPPLWGRLADAKLFLRSPRAYSHF